MLGGWNGLFSDDVLEIGSVLKFFLKLGESISRFLVWSILVSPTFFVCSAFIFTGNRVGIGGKSSFYIVHCLFFDEVEDFFQGLSVSFTNTSATRKPTCAIW